jgi:hypothetical protein
MAASGKSIDSFKDVGVELVSGLDDRLIGNVDNSAVVVEVVAVVVTRISLNWKLLRFLTESSSSIVIVLRR